MSCGRLLRASLTGEAASAVTLDAMSTARGCRQPRLRATIGPEVLWVLLGCEGKSGLRRCCSQRTMMSPSARPG